MGTGSSLAIEKASTDGWPRSRMTVSAVAARALRRTDARAIWSFCTWFTGAWTQTMIPRRSSASISAGCSG